MRDCPSDCATQGLTLKSGRIVRACEMHRSRYRRTGSFGSAAPRYTIGAGESGRVRANTLRSAKLLAAIRAVAGDRWVSELAPGKERVRLRCVYRKRMTDTSFQVSNNALVTLERRGWIATETRQHTKVHLVTQRGRAATQSVKEKR